MVRLVDVLGGVMMVFKEALLVNFRVKCVVMLLVGSMVGRPYHFLLFHNEFFHLCKKKNKKTMSCCVIHEKNGDKTKVN